MTKLEKILQKNTVVHCKNEEEIEYLYDLIKDSLILYDKNDFLPLCKDFIEKNDKVCFYFYYNCYNYISWQFSDIDCFEEMNYNIIECEDLMDEEFTKYDLKWTE